MHQKDYRSENELLQNNHHCGNGNEIVSGTRMQNVSERLPCAAVGRRGILRRRLGQKTTAVAVKWEVRRLRSDEPMTDETMKFRAVGPASVFPSSIYPRSWFKTFEVLQTSMRVLVHIDTDAPHLQYLVLFLLAFLKDEGYIRQTSAILWKILILLLVMRAWTGSGIENMSTCFLVPIVKLLCDRNRTSSHSLSSLRCSHSYL